MTMQTRFLFLVLAGCLQAAEPQGTRGIVPEEVLKARPSAAVAPALKSPAAPIYRAAGGAPARPVPGSRQVGVTIWRLRAAASGGPGARILVREDAATAEFVPERVGAASSLREGDRVRLSVESPDSGYLYARQKGEGSSAGPRD